MSEFTGEKTIPVRVALRARPLLQHELSEGASECLTFVQDANQVVVNGNKAFTYDYVFNTSTSQEVVYSTSVAPLISGIFKGFNGTVLAYGQTGSGKTYSMGSAHCVSQASETDSSVGVIPRVIDDLFSGIASRDMFDFLVNVSYVEIYKEELKDLLAPKGNKQSNLAIHENPDGSIRIAGLTEVVVSSPSETLEFMERGNCARSTGSTAMNATSSRSHAIFTITLQSRSLEDADEFTCSKLHLVDLAGSERAKRTKAQGERFQEGIKINEGLLALGNVISALGDRRHGDNHIPYRDSKLTRILQDSLGGNSLTVMIVCVSPADCNAEETINTLRYADRARKIKNKPMVNRDPQTAELVSLRKEVQQLRLKLLQTTGSTSVEVASPRQSATNQERIDALEDEKRHMAAEMQKLVDSNTDMCEKAIATDLLCERLQGKLSDLRSEAEKVADDPHDLSVAEQAIDEDQQRECIKNLRALHKKLLGLQTDGGEECSPEEIISNLTTAIHDKVPHCDNGEVASTSSSMADESAVDTSLKADHILRTAKLSNQLQELTNALAMKEELAKRMCAGGEDMGMLKSQYEEKLTKLDKQIGELQKEKDALASALEAAVKNNENRIISEQRRRRLLELENQIKELKNEKKEKVANLRVQSDQKITKLNSEIQSMKSSRVKLMRQIKDGNQKFLATKKEKEREVKQLTEKDRKRQYEIMKLERDFMKQKNVLRRKTEEAAVSYRRLKEALNKQKSAAYKRQQSQSGTLDSANTNMRAWLEEDLEIAVRVKEAKKHLEVLEEDLKLLQRELDNMVAEAPSKRRCTLVNADEDDLKRKRQELEDEIELKVIQAKELKSKLQDAKNARTSQQTRWVQITSIGEARAIMKHLFGLTVASRMAEEEILHEKRRLAEGTGKQRIRCTALERQIEQQEQKIEQQEQKIEQQEQKIEQQEQKIEQQEQKIEQQERKIEQQERKIEQQERDRENSITTLESTHHEQMLFLVSQLNQSSSNPTVAPATQREADLQAQIKIQASVIQEMKKQQERLGSDDGDDVTFSEPAKAAKKPKRVIVYATTDEDSDSPSSESESEYEPTPRPRRRKKWSAWVLQCFCSKSQCASKVCPCRKAGTACTELCHCVKCKNTEQNLHSKEVDSTITSDDGESLETSDSMHAQYCTRRTGTSEDSPPLSPGKLLQGQSKYLKSPLREANSTGGDSQEDGGTEPPGKSQSVKPRKRRRLDLSDQML